MGTKNFTFGAYDYHEYEPNDRPPVEVVDILKLWADQFEEGLFRQQLFSRAFNAWIVSHDDIADNIDLIARRLENVLNELRNLQP